jgi:integrase
MNDMVKYYTTDTIRQSLTVLWAMVPSLKQHPYLRGLHAKLKRKGVKKNDAHVIYPEEFKLLMQDDRLSDLEKLILATHITLGCREGREEVWIRGRKVRGGLLGLDWSNVHWENGLPVAVDVFETKAKGGIWWLNVKLDLFFKWLPGRLKEYWERQGRPREGRIFPISYSKLLAIYKKVRKILNEYREQGLSPTMAVSELTPHDARRTHAMWLILADVPFEVIAGGLRGEKINSPLGVLWITDITLVEYYADLMPKALKSVELVEKWASKVFE